MAGAGFAQWGEEEDEFGGWPEQGKGGGGGGGRGRGGGTRTQWLPKGMIPTPPTFSGSSSDSGRYRQFRWSLLNYITLIDSRTADGMIAAEAFEQEIQPTTSEEDNERSRALYAILGSLLKGPALRKLQQGRLLASRNGFEAFRQLSMEFLPRVGNRKLAMLQQVLNPGFHSGMNDDQWREEYSRWVAILDETEALLGPDESLPASIKVALILGRAPSAVRDQLELHSSQYENDPERLVEAIEAFLRSRRMFAADHGAIPMDVDRVGAFAGTCHTCGVVGHRASECRRGGKSKGKGKSKSSSNNGASPSEPETCFKCGRTGHRARDCYAGSGRGKGGGASSASGYSGGYSSSFGGSSSKSKPKGRGKGKAKGKGKHGKGRVRELDDVDEEYEQEQEEYYVDEEYEEEYEQEEEVHQVQEPIKPQKATKYSTNKVSSGSSSSSRVQTVHMGGDVDKDVWVY